MPGICVMSGPLAAEAAAIAARAQRSVTIIGMRMRGVGIGYSPTLAAEAIGKVDPDGARLAHHNPIERWDIEVDLGYIVQERALVEQVLGEELGFPASALDAYAEAGEVIGRQVVGAVGHVRFLSYVVRFEA